MARMELFGAEDVENVAELLQRLDAVADNYGGASLRGAIARPSLVNLDKESNLFGGDGWASAIMEIILKPNEKERRFDELLTREGFKIYEALVPIEELLELMETIHQERRLFLEGHEIRLREHRTPETWSVTSRRQSSNEERYDSLERDWPTRQYEINGLFGGFEYDGNSIQEQTVPSPFNLHEEDPPLLNIPDAIEHHLGYDGRQGHEGTIYVFEPDYRYRIRDYELDLDAGLIDVKLAAYQGKINESSGLTLHLVRNPRSSGEELRVTEEVTSASTALDAPNLPEQAYILLARPGEGVLDVRMVSPGGPASQDVEIVDHLAENRPWEAAPIARMALLRHLRSLCSESGIPWDDDDETPELSARLLDRGKISGFVRQQLKAWYQALSQGAHLKRNEISEDRLRSTLQDVLRYLAEKGYGDETAGAGSPAPMFHPGPGVGRRQAF